MPKALPYFEFSVLLTLFLIFQCVDMWKRSPCNLAIPSEVDVSQFMNCTDFHVRFLRLTNGSFYFGKTKTLKLF